jgi:hypothetical protein
MTFLIQVGPTYFPSGIFSESFLAPHIPDRSPPPPSYSSSSPAAAVASLFSAMAAGSFYAAAGYMVTGE